MQFLSFLGIMGVIGIIAIFLTYFISSVMISSDSTRVDEIPENHFTNK